MPYPGRLANSLGLIARLTGGGLTTRVYSASQGGFNTDFRSVYGSTSSTRRTK